MVEVKKSEDPDEFWKKQPKTNCSVMFHSSDGGQNWSVYKKQGTAGIGKIMQVQSDYLPKPSRRTHKSRSVKWIVGDRVFLQKLKKNPENNGKRGTIIKIHQDNIFDVNLDNGKMCIGISQDKLRRQSLAFMPSTCDVIPGTIFGKKFEISKKLGRGAFGEVYSAVNLYTKQQVAAKLQPITSRKKKINL